MLTNSLTAVGLAVALALGSVAPSSQAASAVGGSTDRRYTLCEFLPILPVCRR